MARSSHQGQKTSSREPFRDVGVGAGDRANAAAWSMLADDWGMPMDAVAPLPKPSPAPLAGDVAGIDGGPGWGFFGMNGSHGMNGDGRARANAGDDVGFLNNFFARNDDASAALRRQMDSVGVACADARASLAAHGQLAAWGARAAAALAGVDARGDPNGVANARAPTAAHAVRVLLAACHAARECERAGSGGNKGVGRGASSSRGSAPRVPQLAAAVGPAAALADAFQTAFFKLVSRYGNDAIRAMAAGDPELKSSSGMNGVDDVAASGEDAAAGLVGLTGAARREGEIAHGLRAPAELERTLETLLKWE